MSVPLLMAVASGAQADDGTASDSLTVGLGGNMPRVTQAQTSRCGRWFLCCRDAKALSLLMRKKVGYDLQNDSGWYFEHTLGYDPEGLIKILAGARAQTI
jgi:hypothetical protein